MAAARGCYVYRYQYGIKMRPFSACAGTRKGWAYTIPHHGMATMLRNLQVEGETGRANMKHGGASRNIYKIEGQIILKEKAIWELLSLRDNSKIDILCYTLYI